MINLEQVMRDFETAAEKLNKAGPCISIFGSARTVPSHKHYKEITYIAKELTKIGYGIITGGGKGIMEAGNKGAKEGQGESIGLSIYLPFETCSIMPLWIIWLILNIFLHAKSSLSTIALLSSLPLGA